MRRSYVIAAFAAVGLTFVGPLTIDAVDFARAVETQNSEALINFARQNPTSLWATDALQLAANQTGNGTNSNNGNGNGNGGTQGNQGDGPNSDKGNGGYAGG